MVHRAILGSVERFIAVLTEHTGGKWPFWVSPRQIIVLPISEKAADYCHSVYLYLHRLGYEVATDKTSGQINKKVRNAQLAQWNYILVAGEDEVRQGLVDVRTRDNKRHGKMRVDDFAEHLKSEEPKRSTSYVKMYENVWDPSNYPKAGQEGGKGAGAAAASGNAEKGSPVMDELDEQLRKSGAQYLSGGAQPSAADREALEKVKASGVLSPQRHPYLYGWYSIVSRYSDEARNGWK